MKQNPPIDENILYGLDDDAPQATAADYPDEKTCPFVGIECCCWDAGQCNAPQGRCVN